MKRNVFHMLAVLICVSVLTTSCVKDAINTVRDLTDNPYWVYADFDPTLGVPVAYGEVTIEDILDLFEDALDTSMIYTNENGILTFKYDTTVSGDLPINGSGSSKNSVPQTIHNYLRFSFGERMNALDSLFLKNVNVRLVAHLRSDFRSNDPSVDPYQLINDNNLHLYIDSAIIRGRGRSGQYFDVLKRYDRIALDSITMNNTNVMHVDVFNTNYDASHLLNERTDLIDYKISMRLDLPSDLNGMLNVSQFVENNLSDDSRIYYQIDAIVEFPISLRANGLTFTDTIPLRFGSLDDFDITIDVAELILDINNWLPIGLELSGNLMDSIAPGNFVPLAPLLTHPYPVRPGNADQYVSELDAYVTPQDMAHCAHDTVIITINQERFEALKRADALEFTLRVVSSGSDQGKFVALRKQDKLMLKSHLLANPHVVIDRPMDSLGRNNNNNNR